MRIGIVLSLILLSSGASLEARDNHVRVRWSELATYVNGMRMSTALPDGTRIEGRAISVENDGISTLVSKSSGPTHLAGKSLLPRASLSIIRVGQTGWKWKVIGPIAGFVGMGTLGGVVGSHVDRGGFIISNGGAYGVLAGMAVGITAGVLVGRWADHHYTTIEIEP